MSGKNSLTKRYKTLKEKLVTVEQEKAYVTQQFIRCSKEKDKLKDEIKKLKKQLQPPWHVRKLTQLKRYVAERSEM